MFIMVSGANLASLYVGLELMALSVYVLVGYFKLEVKSNEGAVKYFVLGGFAFGAVYMATDPVSASMTSTGKLWYGALIGVMCALIRVVNGSSTASASPPTV